jgi:hypothetical protein
MVGARVDQVIVTQLIKQKMVKLGVHFEKCAFDPGMVTLQWFTCLFSYNFNYDIVLRLWDMFFIKGDKILFRISLAIFHLLQARLL